MSCAPTAGITRKGWEGLSAASRPRRPEPPGQRTSRRRPGTL